MQLYEALSMHVAAWREDGYKHEEYPAIAEILEWASNPDVPNFRLRAPQLRALETYWYLQLVEETPHIFDLYQSLFPKKKDLLEAFGISDEAFSRADYDVDSLVESITNDPDFVKEFRLEAVRETLVLDYPSYILALAMGAGKTILIGAIFATEFAMAQEYPDNGFVENALVFAPGKTIIESLRELAEMKYEAVLPPRMYKSFAATLKLTFTLDGDPDIPVTRGSSWNVIVTNTEKIRIQKENIRKSDLGPLFNKEKEDEAKAEVANLRLQAIASLPKLAIFSDEAHHTYGQAMDADLKKVRKTVDYLHNPHSESEKRAAHETQLVCVVNTTGTPYFQRQPLRDVVAWYGLSEGIHDGILKEVAGNIYGIDFQGNEKEYLSFVVEDFFKSYDEVALPDGTLGKKLVKIVPFNHPVTPLDLEEVKKELKDRPDEERDIVVVGLGKEIAIESWLDEWNKLRKQGNIPNKIEVIELRSDPKYGGFFTHEPAKAKVTFKRVKENVEITIDDFISPTILERLKQQNKDNPLFQPQVSDWRSMVDSVIIDANYDGKVFNITLADVPEKKNDLVEGKYVVEAKKGATIAVKVTDMLGEEVWVVKQV
jgi:hypothetical protein